MPQIINIPGQGQVQFPDGMTDDQITAAIKANTPKSAPVDPTAGMSAFQKIAAGYGKSIYDMGRGAGELVGDAAQGLGFNRPSWAPTKADIDEAHRLDAPLMNTGAGKAGAITGALVNMAPLALAPGVNTIAGGAAYGALSGMAQPVGSNESRVGNALVGTVAGGALPAVTRAAKLGKAVLIDPFTQAGQQRIVGGALNRAASDPNAAMANLLSRKAATPGFMPSAAQASGDSGIASLSRAAEAIDPGGFQAMRDGQTSALVNALRGVAGTPEARSAAVAARDDATESLYKSAKDATVTGDPDLSSLLQRPSMQSAAARATNLTRERNGAFSLPQATKDQVIPSSLVDASGNPLSQTVIPGQPAQYSGQLLHDLKMGLDDAIGTPGLGGMQGAERGAALGTKSDYQAWLESKIPEYGQARSTYAEMSKPINQMDIGQELYKRFVPALADTGGVPFKSRADALANALRNGDDLARNITGMKGATLSGTMTPEQLATLNGVVSDAGMKAAADTAGRGVGSDTVQKMAMSHVLAQSGIPNWVQSLGRVPGGWLKTFGDVLYSKNDGAIRSALSNIIKDPQAAAQAMQMAKENPGKLMQIMQTAGQGAMLSSPALINSVQQ